MASDLIAGMPPPPSTFVVGRDAHGTWRFMYTCDNGCCAHWEGQFGEEPPTLWRYASKDEIAEHEQALVWSLQLAEHLATMQEGGHA